MTQDDNARLKAAADKLVSEVLQRRDAARSIRQRALAQAAHSVVETRTTHTLTAAHLGARPESTAAIRTATVQTAGYLLAIGDSWFDYPINDVLTKLDAHYGYNIESSAHRGDAVEMMVSHVGQLDKFARKLDKILALGASPKAVLVSGGGDDLAGAEFGMLINDIDLTIAGWNDQVLAGVIETRVATAYRKLIYAVNSICEQRMQHKVPIVVHGYDYPVPDGRGFLGGWGILPGPWLKPGFDEKLFVDLDTTTAMMVTLIDRFNAMLVALTKDPDFANVHYVDLRGTLSNKRANDEYKQWWENEIHPTGGAATFMLDTDGFKEVAAKIQAVLVQLPPMS